MRNQILSSLLLVLLANPTAAETRVIHAGTLLAVPGQAPLQEQTVVIKDGMVTELASGYRDAAEYGAAAQLIDLRHSFVLPGMMDMHVHLQGELGPKNDTESLRWSNELVQMYSIRNAMRTLQAGFTTLRDVGSRSQEMYAVRDAINKGWIDGPRIIAAGGVGITGGHADVSGVNPEFMQLLTDDSICDGPYDCRRATRNQIKYAADLIGMSSTLGSIEVGKHADIIATDASPLENIEELLDVDFVMKGGKVFKNDRM